MEPGISWICAQTRPLLETQALRNLNNQKYQSFFPFFLHKTKNTRMVRPLFPGYIFIKLPTDQAWMPINNTYGIHRVMTHHQGEYTVPHIMPNSFIDTLSRRIISTDKWMGQEIEAGTRVKILKGALGDQEAFVQWKKEQRIGLLFSIMGREVEVEFNMADIAVV